MNLPFELINGIRKDNTNVHDAIREAVANAIIHADYNIERGIVIERGKTYLKFSNQGSLRISIEEAMSGGISDPRNENIFKMFYLIGVGERAGSGLETIKKAWKEQEWTIPDLEESFGPDRVELTLRTISLLPKESIEFIKNTLGEDYKKLDKDDIMALVAAHQEGYITNNRLQQLIDNHSLHSNKVLSKLVNMGYLKSQGIGKGTKYLLGEIFDSTNMIDTQEIEKNDHLDEFLNVDEIKIINFIKGNGFITNALCRDNLGFGKTKSTQLFKKLIESNEIERVGTGSKIHYVIKK